MKRKAKIGRPLAKVDPAVVQALARIHCTYPEIAAVVGCDERTLHRRFVGIIEKGKEEGRASLRRLQFKSAEGGNVTAQIWLGKQLLGQADQSRVETRDVSKMTPEEVEAEAKRLGLA